MRQKKAVPSQKLSIVWLFQLLSRGLPERVRSVYPQQATDPSPQPVMRKEFALDSAPSPGSARC